jgi:hypothetical protein
MTIDEAIENLKAEKRRGTKSVIIAWWNADQFGRADDETWEHAADVVERKHDWSGTHDDLSMTLDLYTSE